MTTPAVETWALTKVFERGRRTLLQRLRREPPLAFARDAGSTTLTDPLLKHAILAALAHPLGRFCFARADRSLRVRGTVGQH